MSHSPGPWKLTDAVVRRSGYESYYTDGIEDANGNSVLRIEEDTNSETQRTLFLDATNDDFHLIQAAPLLLAELIRLRNVVHRWGHSVRLADQAIAAARGKVPSDPEEAVERPLYGNFGGYEPNGMAGANEWYEENRHRFEKNKQP